MSSLHEPQRTDTQPSEEEDDEEFQPPTFAHLLRSMPEDSSNEAGCFAVALGELNAAALCFMEYTGGENFDGEWEYEDYRIGQTDDAVMLKRVRRIVLSAACTLGNLIERESIPSMLNGHAKRGGHIRSDVRSRTSEAEEKRAVFCPRIFPVHERER